jgi:hypothetical protein
VINPDGSMTWFNGGPDGAGGWNWTGPVTTATGVGAPGDDIHLADLNGDGMADYLVVDPATGGVQAWLNGGSGTTWYPQGLVATGVGALGYQVRLADLNGDGMAEYLVVNPNTGAVQAWLNGGPNPNGGWVWLPQDIVATGVGSTGNQIRFADMNGDHRAD